MAERRRDCTGPWYFRGMHHARGTYRPPPASGGLSPTRREWWSQPYGSHYRECGILRVARYPLGAGDRSGFPSPGVSQEKSWQTSRPSPVFSLRFFDDLLGITRPRMRRSVAGGPDRQRASRGHSAQRTGETPRVRPARPCRCSIRPVSVSSPASPHPRPGDAGQAAP